jgi:Domain of unknown function (DUF4365)
LIGRSKNIADCKSPADRLLYNWSGRYRTQMSDELLSIQDRQEALSRAYAAVIAAGAGYATYAPDFDRDSIDLGFSAGGRMRPNLHVQLKATINLRKAGDHFKFLLKKKNYDDLRAPTQVPRVLVVLALPKKEEGWLNVSVKQLVVKRCAYWLSLRDSPELPDGQQSITVALPAANTFDVDGLRRLMEQATHGVVS